MPVTDHQVLNKLCTACGIAVSYQDIHGEHCQPDLQAKQALLSALGHAVDNDSDIRRRLETLQRREWQRIIAPVQMSRLHDPAFRIRLTLSPAQIKEPLLWNLTEEAGTSYQGQWTLDPVDSINERHVNSTLLRQFEVEIPQPDKSGYHRLSIATCDGYETISCFIVTPEACFQPQDLDNGEKIWGINLQLYALRSRRNWGIGDFTDLCSVVNYLTPLGADFIALNPLHALFSHRPKMASPYSPTSRSFLNPIYLDIEAIAEIEDNPELQLQLNSRDFKTKLDSLRGQDLVNYRIVWTEKLQALKTLYRDFRKKHLEKSTVRAKAFRQFQRAGGNEIHRFGLFEALQNHFYEADREILRWQQWPADFQDPESKTVCDWAAKNVSRIEFYQYLQWLAEQQLESVRNCCRRQGMAIGIIRDLAIGVDKSAQEVWSEQAFYAKEATIGAPADDFNANGQNWDLPPLIPQALVEDNYRLFINILRSNMRHAGALRIDHIMGLMRLFWIPQDGSADRGSYVSYPVADMLGILALESQRNQCLIIGEDLGTVPDELRQALFANKIFSYRILFFEKNWHQGTYKSPCEYPQHALCTTGSHDLPTLSAFWQESDIELHEQLKLFASDDERNHRHYARQQDRTRLLAALAQENLINSEEMYGAETAKELGRELALSIQLFLARSEAAIMSIQIEDLFMELRQINIPGTTYEYPNWRNKLSSWLEDWPQHRKLEHFIQAVNLERRR